MLRQSSSRGEELSRPQLIQALIDSMKVPDLRNKILFTFAMLLIFRFVAHVPVPGVDTQALSQAFRQQALLGFLDFGRLCAYRNCNCKSKSNSNGQQLTQTIKCN